MFYSFSGRVKAGAYFFPLCLVFTLTASQGNAEDMSDEAQILEVRERSNTALRELDADALVATLMPDYHIVTSSNRKLAGHSDQRKFMQYITENFPDAIYQRTPETIEINREANTAAEKGTWQGKWTEAGKEIVATGSYFARWQKSQGEWLIQAEIFVRLN